MWSCMHSHRQACDVSPAGSMQKTEKRDREEGAGCHSVVSYSTFLSPLSPATLLLTAEAKNKLCALSCCSF